MKKTTKILIGSLVAVLGIALVVLIVRLVIIPKKPIVPDAQPTQSVKDENTEPEESEVNEDASEESGKGGGGIPWIDSNIKENVTKDTPVDPKDDFHLYANKEWILASSIPDGYGSWSHYQERSLEVKNQCIDLLSDEGISGHDADLVRTYNRLILDWDARNKEGVSGLKDLYEQILAAESIEEISKLIVEKPSSDKLSGFVDFFVTTGLNDPETYLAGVSTPSLLLNDSSEYAERSEYGDMYYGYEKDLFVFLANKFGMTKEEAEKRFDDAINLETKLSEKIYTTEEELNEDFYDKINNELSYEEVVALSKNYPLGDIIDNIGLKYDGVYLVIRPDYFEVLDEVYTNENLDSIKSFLLIGYLLDYSKFIDRETYDKKSELAETYFGMSGQVPDEEMASDMVSSALPASMQKVYIQKYGSEESKKKLEDLCRQVIDTYRELLSENTWASDEVKNYAIEKLDKMEVHAAYPDKFRDTSAIDIEGCTLLEAAERIYEQEEKYQLSLLGKKIDKEMWAEGFNILTCNAFYDPTANTVNMIIGMMGDPFFSDDMSIEELYASIGAFWVGHEVSHAFDSNGALFDADGVYRDWWTEQDKAEFDKRIKKMDDYLDTIVAFDDKHFIGGNIDTEMAADMTGLQCALRMASKIEGFDYDKFFTKYAQMNVSLANYSQELAQLTQDPHPLDYSRTNVPVQQFQEFYDTYGIKEGDKMYLAPEDRLIIW